MRTPNPQQREDATLASASSPLLKVSLRVARGPSLMVRIVDALGRAIVHGHYPQESPLPPETELARSIGAGRNVIREAIKVLSAKGLVRVAHGSGTPVLPQSEWNFFDQQVIGWTLESEAMRDGLVDELSTLRFVIEPEVAALAASSATTTEVLRLFEAYEQMEANLSDRNRAVEADILFHRRLFEACHNRLMTQFLRTVITVLRANFELAIMADHMVIRFLEEHREVAEAVHRHEPDSARVAMQGLLLNNRKNLTEMRDAIRTVRSAEGMTQS